MLPEILTLEYLLKEEEDQYLDRKSTRIKPIDIARHLAAFTCVGKLKIDDKMYSGLSEETFNNLNEYKITTV